MQPPRQVAFDGYFFKRYRYQSGDTKPGEKGRDTVLLIGHSPVVAALPPAAAADSPFGSWASPLLLIFLSLVAAAVGLVAVLHVWFRRSDSRVRDRLAEKTAAEFVPPAPPPLAEPVGGGVSEPPAAGPGELNFDDRGGPRRGRPLASDFLGAHRRSHCERQDEDGNEERRADQQIDKSRGDARSDAGYRVAHDDELRRLNVDGLREAFGHARSLHGSPGAGKGGIPPAASLRRRG